MLPTFAYISAALSVLLVIPYVRDILRHKTKPERGTWIIWTVLGFISFFSQMAKGATVSLWFTGVQTVGVVITFLLSIKYGYGGLVKRDAIALALAAFGLVLWYLTKDASYALFIVIVIDGIGVYLTVVKAYADPGSETLSSWLISSVAGVFAMFSVGVFNPILLAYPFYIAIANLVVVGSILLGRKRHKK